MLACGVNMKEIQERLGHSAISTTANIYSHLNYSSKLNVANTLTNAFGGRKLKVEEQNSDEAKALLASFLNNNPLCLLCHLVFYLMLVSV